MTRLSLILIAVVCVIWMVVVPELATAQPPPRPDAHPAACKHKPKKCRAHVAGYWVPITWNLTIDGQPAGTIKGRCWVPPRGRERCEITVSWGTTP